MKEEKMERWTRRAPHMEQFTDVKPIVVDGYPDAHTVWLRVGNQHFTISAGGQDFYETKEEAEWTRDMLCIALDGMVTSTRSVAEPT
jgi:hypothetical protein